MDWFAIKRARALILLDFDFNISFRAGKVVWTFEKRVPGLKTGVENDILWSEIGSGFGEPGGTWAAHHHQEYPPPRIPPPPSRIRFWEMNWTIQRKEIFPADSANVRYPVGSDLSGW